MQSDASIHGRINNSAPINHRFKDNYICNKMAYMNLKTISTESVLTGGYVSVRELAKVTPDEPTKLKDIGNENIYDMFPTFPNVDKDKLMINKTGLYSMTKPEAAEKILEVIRRYIDTEQSTIINATCGIGGDLINMCNHFKKTYGYEINKVQFTILENNVRVYGFNNSVELFNEDYTKNINREKCDIVMIDPPWGGLDYKELKFNNTMMGPYTMDEIVDKIFGKDGVSLIVLKLPRNQDMRKLWPKKPKVHKIDNYQLVIFKR